MYSHPAQIDHYHSSFGKNIANASRMARKIKDASAGTEWHSLQIKALITMSSNQMALVYLIPMKASWFVTTQKTLTFTITEIYLSLSKQHH